MNANAKEFKFNGAAPSWTPAPTSSLPPTPPVVVEEKVVVVLEEKVVERNDGYEENNEEEEIDENDPLWKATLKICEGDKTRALKMLGDPDALMKHPEIKAILDSSEDVVEDWENTEPIVDEKEKEVKKVVEEVTGSKVAEPSPVIKKSDSSSELVVEDEVIESDLQECDPREHLNIVFIGHVDAGKSTLSGSILYLMGMVDTRTIEKFEREAKTRNRESWFLAFIMDTSEEERAKGKTVEVGRALFETEKSRYTILDAPGHKNYVPNMIAGATQADCAILVISARKGEFETGFEKGGQTREHALLAKTLGVQHLVVVINKMDDPTVKWDVERYEECVSKLKPFLKQCGYVIKKDVKFIPIAGLHGDNVLNEVSGDKCKWWKEYYTKGTHNTTAKSLISCLDELTLVGRNDKAPLRIPCLDRYFERGVNVMGKVESGTITVGDEICIAPTKKKAKVESISIGDVKVRSAKPGESVLLKFNVNSEDVQKGYVICHQQSMCVGRKSVKVQLALTDMLETRPIFSIGYDAMMHVHTVDIEAQCTDLVSVNVNNKPSKRPFARTGQTCVCVLSFSMTTCMETFLEYPTMGRFTLRDEGKTIGIGKIIELM
jgi:peptide chain release factor subunit 3